MDKIRVIGGILNAEEENAIKDIIDSYTDVDYAEAKSAVILLI